METGAPYFGVVYAFSNCMRLSKSGNMRSYGSALGSPKICRTFQGNDKGSTKEETKEIASLLLFSLGHEVRCGEVQYVLQSFLNLSPQLPSSSSLSSRFRSELLPSRVRHSSPVRRGEEAQHYLAVQLIRK